MANLQIFSMFLLINQAAQKTGETVVPLNCSIESQDYYGEQMVNLGFNAEQIDKFLFFLGVNGDC